MGTRRCVGPVRLDAVTADLTSRPTPLDSLIASHIYVLFTLDLSSVLRSSLESKEILSDYVDRVMSYATSKMV
jgi:metaxin